MTPQEKVLNLIENSYDILPDDGTILLLGKDKAFEIAKKCAIIAVEEIIKALELAQITSMDGDWGKLEWQEVKQEIEKL